MNPASVSHVNSVKQYVDRRDNSTLGKAKAYTDGALKGVAAQKGATTEKDRDGGAIFPWWLLPLLGWLLFAAIIIALLWALWSGLRGLWIQFIDWILCHRCPPTIEEEPEAKPEPAKSPDIVNTDDGDYYGYDSAPARVNCFFDGTTVIKKWKGVWNRSKGCSWKWAAADKEVEVNFGVGDKMTFGLSRENTGNVPVSTEGVVIRDDFNARTFGKFVPGSGKLIVSSKVVRDLDDALIERVMSGYAIKLSDLIDILPAKSSATIVYSVSCVPCGSTTGPAGGVPDEHDAPSQPLVRLADLEAKWATEAAAKKAEEDAKAKAEADAKAKIEAEAKAKAEAEVKAKAKTEKNADKDKTESAKNEKAKDKPKKEPVKVEDNKPKPEPEPTKKTEDVDIAKLIDSEFEEEN